MPGYAVTFSVVDQATAQIEAINNRIRQMRAPIEASARAAQRMIDPAALRKISDGFTDIARRGGEAFSSLSRLVPVMGQLTGAASIAGMASLAQAFSGANRELQRTATRLNTTSRDLQVLRDAVTLAGGDVNDMTEGLKGLQQTAANAFKGDPQAVAWFNKIGVSVTDTNGNLRSVTDLMPEVIRKIGEMEQPTDRMTAAVGLGSGSLAQMAEDFRRSRQPMETWIAKAREIPGVTQQQIEVQGRYQQALANTQIEVTHLRDDLGSMIAEGLTPALEAFGNWLGELRKNPEAMENVRLAVVALAGAFSVTLVAGVAAALRSITAFMASAPVAGLLALIGAVQGLRQLLGKGEEQAEATGESRLLTTARELLVPEWAQKYFTAEPEKLGAYQQQQAAERAQRQQERAERGFSVWKPSTWFGGGAKAPEPAAAPAPATAAPAQLTGSKQEFFQKAWPLAQKVGAETGIDPRIIMAQAALESGWGTSQKARELGNYFGITGGKGETGPFAVHGGLEQSFEAYARLMKGERYRGVREAQGFEAQVAALNASPYTPEQDYGAKIAAIAGGLPQPGGAAAATSGHLGRPSQRGLQGDLAQRTGAFGTPQQAGQNLVTVKAPSGASFRVHKEAAAQFQGFLDELGGTGYNITSSGGYNPREKRVGGGWSSHAYGTAIDINAATNPQGSKLVTDLPENIGDIAARHGLRWGGEFSKPDAMHFELAKLRKELVAEGKPLEVTGGPPVSGSVDITVTHKNPPPGATVTAAGTGDVNVGSPRTEQQQLAAAA